MLAAHPSSSDEAGALENADVLGDGVEGDRERTGDLGHARFSAREPLEDGSARGVGEGEEGLVEVGGRHLIFTRKGEYYDRSAGRQAHDRRW